MLRRLALLLLVLLPPFAAAGADYERETKWADEILPGLVVGEPVWLEAAGRKFLALHTEASAAGKSDVGIVLVHGIGVHPDWGLIGVLRTRLADAGHATLSIQMPVLAADARSDAYPPTFPEASARIATALAYLRQRGHSALAIVAHSLGARMANDYLAGRAHPGAGAYVAIGLSAPWPQPLPPALPVLDIHGSADLPQVLEAAQQRKLAGQAHVRQTRIEGADHFFAGTEQPLLDAIDTFLRLALPPR